MSYQTTVDHVPSLSQDDLDRTTTMNRLERDRKAWDILWKNLNATKSNYKMYYAKAEQQPAKASYYNKLAKQEYKNYMKISKLIDRIKELEEKIFKKKQLRYKSKLLNQFVNYQQDCIKNNKDIDFTREDVKRIKKIR